MSWARYGMINEYLVKFNALVKNKRDSKFCRERFVFYLNEQLQNLMLPSDFTINHGKILIQMTAHVRLHLYIYAKNERSDL